jgi:3-oxoacyl-[acyl-carrier protein] reductase
MSAKQTQRNLEGKVAIVTGSSRGIGKGIAVNLAQRGATVVINYVASEDKAKKVQKEIIEVCSHQIPDHCSSLT